MNLHEHNYVYWAPVGSQDMIHKRKQSNTCNPKSHWVIAVNCYSSYQQVVETVIGAAQGKHVASSIPGVSLMVQQLAHQSAWPSPEMAE